MSESFSCAVLSGVCLLGLGADSVHADDASLAAHFGFDAHRTVVIDDGFGPTRVADINNDGRPDLITVNNAKSRIELHLLRASPRSENEQQATSNPNDLPPNPWYDREDVSVSSRIVAFVLHDFDSDGDQDIIYTASSPAEIVTLRQTDPASFEVASRRRVRALNTAPRSLVIADLVGDTAPELVTLVDSRISAFPIRPTGTLAAPTTFGTKATYFALETADFDGDGLLDLMGIIPSDPAPVRIWLQTQNPTSQDKDTRMGAELRFEMPELYDANAVTFPNRDAASLGVVERATQRLVFFDLVSSEIADRTLAAEAEFRAMAQVNAFADGSSGRRPVLVTDLNADGRSDLLIANPASNTVSYISQSERLGLTPAANFSAFKDPASLAVGQWDDSPMPEVFVLSEEEKAVGVSFYDPQTNELSFPVPLKIATAGAEPVAVSYLGIDRNAVAVVTRKRRDHQLELHLPQPASDEALAEKVIVVELEGVSRPPQTILPVDADQDGITDLLLLTPGEPMVMVRSTTDLPDQVLTDETMPNFGLVKSAGPDNTALLDIDNDGISELLIAEQNLVRACRYDSERGWIVVDQITLDQPGLSLAGLTVLNPESTNPILIAADRVTGQLILFTRTSPDARYAPSQRVLVSGFNLGQIHAGRFTGNDDPSVLCIGQDGYAIIPLKGSRLTLEQFAAYRSDRKDRQEHELSVGDVNSDGYTDVVVLDAAQQMCELFTFSAARRLHFATEFQVFESRMFSRGMDFEFEPSDAYVTDATGDGHADLVLIVHDRILIYPQTTQASE